MRVDIGDEGNLYDTSEYFKGFIVQNERYRIECVRCADFVLDQFALNITARFMLNHITLQFVELGLAWAEAIFHSFGVCLDDVVALSGHFLVGHRFYYHNNR